MKASRTEAVYYTAPFYARLVLEPYIAIDLVDVEPVKDIEQHSGLVDLLGE